MTPPTGSTKTSCWIETDVWQTSLEMYEGDTCQNIHTLCTPMYAWVDVYHAPPPPPTPTHTPPPTHTHPHLHPSTPTTTYPHTHTQMEQEVGSRNQLKDALVEYVMQQQPIEFERKKELIAETSIKRTIDMLFEHQANDTNGALLSRGWELYAVSFHGYVCHVCGLTAYRP